MDETRSGIGWWGIVIVIFLLFIVCGWGNRGFGGGFGGCGNGYGLPYGVGCGLGAEGFGFQNYKATCDAEKAEIINTATTQYRVEQQAAQTRELIQSDGAATRAKIDFYAYQDLRDKLAEAQRENTALQTQLYSDAKFNALQQQLSTIQCNMLVKPNITGIGAVCPNAGILNGLGFNGFGPLFNNGGCGCGGSI